MDSTVEPPHEIIMLHYYKFKLLQKNFQLIVMNKKNAHLLDRHYVGAKQPECRGSGISDTSGEFTKHVNQVHPRKNGNHASQPGTRLRRISSLPVTK